MCLCLFLTSQFAISIQYATDNKLPCIKDTKNLVTMCGMCAMAIPVVEFLREGFKIRKVFG